MSVIIVQESTPWFLPHVATLLGVTLQAVGAVMRRRAPVLAGAALTAASALWQRDAATFAAQGVMLLILLRITRKQDGC